VPILFATSPCGEGAIAADDDKIDLSALHEVPARYRNDLMGDFLLASSMR